VAHACIDIGSNTTRLLVAEFREGRLRELASQRAFTRIGRGLASGGRITPSKVVETAEIVAQQRRVAADLGVRTLAVVATAAVREAANGRELLDAVHRAAGVKVELLSDEEEARLAFVGATQTLGAAYGGSVAVIDVGGGSTEIAVGTLDDGVSWWRSFALGSGMLTDAHLASDPPRPAELRAAQADVAQRFADLSPPVADSVVAVGGSARAVRKLVGQELGPGALARAVALIAATPADAIADRFDVDPDRASLLAGGTLILDELVRRLGRPLTVGQGGLREGIVVELAAGLRPPSRNGGSPEPEAAGGTR
jgi:exopolyphosphatase / guanosine-5'-triphosphate,3'-diphosphate pyrophosphatase